ncbi:MAG: hypothetical protein IPP94_13465 [Ignavibacteria bacterium]|nr:hypothetical protein [Ignavibacteria bacterium]
MPTNSTSSIHEYIMTRSLALQPEFDEAYKSDLDAAIGEIGTPLFTLLYAAFKEGSTISGNDTMRLHCSTMHWKR